MFVVKSKWSVRGKSTVALLALFLVQIVFAQSAAKITAVEPASGKVDDTVTLTGENLDKDNVVAVFLSDDAEDYKATLVDQTAAKIVMKVPKTKAGGYNVSVQVKDRILILPVKFSVTE